MKRGYAIFMLALLLTSCLPQQRPPLLMPWVYTDLRFMDGTSPSEGDILPEQDLIAVYSRAIETELQIRLDLLDLETQPAVDLYLALDTAPGGNQLILQNFLTEIDWDTLLMIPATGSIKAINAEGETRPGLAVRVLRDPLADTITISLDRSALPTTSIAPRFQVIMTKPGDSIPTDSSIAIDTSLPNPPRVPVLLAFWNTLAAYTPSQAMRRWDGAHTGPFGGRHGLRNLLRVARNHHMPLALLDLKTPSSLSALEYVGGMQVVRAMAAEDLLILPDSAPIDLPSLPDQIISNELSESRATATSARLPNSPFAYLPSQIKEGSISPIYSFIFTQVSDPAVAVGNGRTQIQRSGTQRVLPLPPLSGVDIGPAQSNEGPPVELRRALVESARQDEENPGSGLLVVGGDLQQSPWGDPQFARLALDWMEAHPWIKLVGSQDLLTQRTAGETSPLLLSDPQNTPPERNNGQSGELIRLIADQVFQAPPNPLTEAARLSLYALYAQASPDTAELDRLRVHYAGQIGPLLAAVSWSENPRSQQDCSQDLDQDGQEECILASEKIFAVFDTQSGSLTYLFARSAETEGQMNQAQYFSPDKTNLSNSVHELIAPSSQFIFGQGDPGQWDLTAGLAADPEVIPGAFFDRGLPFAFSLSEGTLTFTAPDTAYTKTYTLLPAGIRADFHSQSPLSVQVPLAIDPWLRFRPDWGQNYTGQSSPNSWTWGLATGSQIQVSSNGEITANSFNDTRDMMGSVEDPNTDFPPSHFLPFPISLVEVHGQGSFFIEIQFQDPGTSSTPKVVP